MTYEMKILEAHNDGKEEGLKEGREEGLKEGLVAGEKNADRRTALRMLNKGKSVEEIMELVDLSREEIEELSTQN